MSQPLDHEGSPQVVISVFLEASIISEQVSTLDHPWGGKRAGSHCIDLQQGLLLQQEQRVRQKSEQKHRWKFTLFFHLNSNT